MTSNHHSLVIVGAGAAGLGAAGRAKALDIDHVVLEASHRLGGRALTEYLANGVPVDLGCHWMHSASVNDMVGRADRLGFSYLKSNPEPAIHIGEVAQESAFARDRAAEGERIELSATDHESSTTGRAIWDHMNPASPHTPWFSYWYSLMHSNDPDQVDIADVVDYHETGEDWPVVEGYGALVAAAGNDAPVVFNTPVEQVCQEDHCIRLTTPRGEFTADRVVITVSTGVLASGGISFSPALPASHRQAIASLLLGNYNNLFFAIEPGGLHDAPPAIAWENDEYCAYIKIRPYGHDMLFTSVAGRFAWWLEKQGERASEQWLRSILVELFGEQVNAQLGQFRASAWGFDPWTLGAYSSLKPGAGPMRRQLSQPVDDRMWFAGEAVSKDAFNTAHGAWRTGEDAVSALAETL